MESIFSFKVQHINLFIAMRRQSYFFSPPAVESHFCGSLSKPSPAVLQLPFHCPLERLGAERQRNRKLPLCSDIALGQGRSPLQVGAGQDLGRGSSGVCQALPVSLQHQVLLRVSPEWWGRSKKELVRKKSRGVPCPRTLRTPKIWVQGESGHVGRRKLFGELIKAQKISLALSSSGTRCWRWGGFVSYNPCGFTLILFSS